MNQQNAEQMDGAEDGTANNDASTESGADTAPRGRAKKMVAVRALVDSAAHGLAAGRLARVSAEQLDGLKRASMVDDDPAAVAYAKKLEA